MNRQRQPPSKLLVAACGVALLVAAGITLFRVSLESSFWIDETYSALVATYPVSKIVDLASIDASPPLYYLVLKVWLKVGRSLGFEGVMWGRLLGFIPWLGLLALMWWRGRRRWGLERTALVAALTGTAPLLLVGIRDLRCYGFASVSLFVVYWMTWEALSDERNGRPRSLAGLGLAAGMVALAAAVAVWMHLLSAVFLVCLSVTASLIVLIGRARSWRSLLPLGLGLILAALSFVPWAAQIAGQIGYVSSSSPDWMTPSTVGNLLAVFGFWYPAGRLGAPLAEGNALFLVLGCLAVLVPLGYGIAARTIKRGEERSEVERPGQQVWTLSPSTGAVLGLGSSTLFVVVLWISARFETAPVFHGERYPGLAAVAFVVGLTCLVLWATQRLGKSLLIAGLVLAPLLLVQLLAQAALAERESGWGLPYWRTLAPQAFPAEGETVYVFPSELIPYYRKTLSGYTVHRIEALPCEVETGVPVTVLAVNPWPILDRPRDYLARKILKSGQLGVLRTEEHFPPQTNEYVVYRLEGRASGLSQTLCDRGFAPLRPPYDEGVELILASYPEDQLPGSEWSFLEVTDEGELFRWSQTATTRLRLPHAVPSGSYELIVRGHRAPYPEEQAEIVVAIGQLEMPPQAVGAGVFELRLPVQLDGDAAREITIRHPSWKPSEVSGTSDTRTLSFGFRGAWLIRKSSS